MPTHHEKIMIGKVREYVFADVETALHTLVETARSNDDRKVVTQMKNIVQEYKSQNSKFEELDSLPLDL
jgi:hypothetical protein